MFPAVIWGTVADWVIVATAVAASLFGWVQLRRLAEANSHQAGVARAELLLQIDQIFEGPDVGESRRAIRTLRNQCEAQAIAMGCGENETELLPQSAAYFSEEVTRLYLAYKRPDETRSRSVWSRWMSAQGEHEPPHVVAGRSYTILMALPYWFETVGLLTKKGLMVKEDVLDLYDAVYDGVLTCFDQHIEHRRREKAEPDSRFLEHATWMRDEARLHITAKKEAAMPKG